MKVEEAPVYAALQSLGIEFERHEHEAAATVQEAEAHWAGIDAMHFKNLFVRNQKGTRHYLLIVRHSKRADLRAIADQIGDGKLSFGSPERLMTHLGVTPGSVKPPPGESSHGIGVLARSRSAPPSTSSVAWSRRSATGTSTSVMPISSP